MVLQNFYKLTIWIFEKKYDYYGSITEYLEFNEKLKHEIIWHKKSNVKDVKQRQLFT
jgi:hypothetical protein